MIDLVLKEIQKPEYGLCNSKPFMKTFNKHLKSKETLFGKEPFDFDRRQIVEIKESKPNGC